MDNICFTPQHSSLTNHILNFVDWFGCVELSLIYRFFRDQASPELLESVITYMIYTRLLFEKDETRVSVVQKTIQSADYYDLTNNALHVMCDNFTSSEIDSFMPGIDVVRLKFHTTYGDSFDVVSFPYNSDYNNILVRALQARKMDAIPGIDDIYTHLAAIPDLAEGGQLHGFGFTYFAAPDKLGYTKLYSVVESD